MALGVNGTDKLADIIGTKGLNHELLGNMMGKGLVVAALLQRDYGDNWLIALQDKMPPAVKPEAMAKLGHANQPGTPSSPVVIFVSQFVSLSACHYTPAYGR